MYLGIDFGTCYSSAAFVLNGSLERVKDSRKLGYSFPSSVFVSEVGEVLVGHTADFQRNKLPERYQREFKRDLGRNIPYQIGGQAFLPEQFVAEVLRKLKQEADAMVTGRGLPPFTAAVITVPATYQATKRNLMRQAAISAGFQEIEILDEPVATGLYYANHYTIADQEVVLVYDLGGGTFDATLIQRQGRTYKVLGLPVGLEQCGGIDFDRAIYHDLLSNAQESLKGVVHPDRRDLEAMRARLMLADWCREAKHQLSEVLQFEDTIPGFFSEFYALQRQTFEQMIQTQVENTIVQCQELLQRCHYQWQDVDRLLLVGGSCRIPYIQAQLSLVAQCPILRVDEPELAVCLEGV